ncbi:hypothetical protein J41TS2_05110 [Bacillus sonorensis]|nr:hypothetical protein J41TS2_05110 [Bacillus sonorensis]
MLPIYFSVLYIHFPKKANENYVEIRKTPLQLSFCKYYNLDRLTKLYESASFGMSTIHLLFFRWLIIDLKIKIYI